MCVCSLRYPACAVIISSVACPVLPYFTGLSWKLKFLDRFPRNSQIQNFMKIRPVGDELIHVHGQTDMTKLVVTFRNFCKRD